MRSAQSQFDAIHVSPTQYFIWLCLSVFIFIIWEWGLWYVAYTINPRWCSHRGYSRVAQLSEFAATGSFAMWVQWQEIYGGSGQGVWCDKFMFLLHA